MDKGYTWFAINNDNTDYVELSRCLAKSIKRHNKINQTCIITDKKIAHDDFDHVIVLDKDFSKDQQWKLNNEWQVFELTPFKHTIKLEADVLLNCNVDWWWSHLHQHNLIFSYDCRNYSDQLVKDKTYRKLFYTNDLPNIYSALTYFRKSREAQAFFNLCRDITLNWTAVKDKMLINCHDKQATTDVVYALALKILDPLQISQKNYEWFSMMHNKNSINGLSDAFINDQYLYTMMVNGNLYSGCHRQSRVFHYHNKSLPKELYG